MMFKWLERVRRGQRASDRKIPAPATPRRDRLLERAIAADAIAIHFQPQIEPGSGIVRGVEALARWEGARKAEELFARAAACGLSQRLSRQVQRKALRIAGAWTGPLADLHLSINLLPEDLECPGYDQWLVDEIAAAGLTAERVTVEITEGGLLADRPGAAERLAMLRGHGVRIAVDDFGTGFCSLAYLTSLPLDAIKIDRGLIADVVGGNRDRIVVKAMIRLARELDLSVIIEGVESTGQLALVAEWGCDLYQGFLGAGALDERELARFVSTNHAEAA